MTIPTEPAAYASWLDELERQWKAGLIPDPKAASIIVMNLRGEVLLQLRENAPHVSFGNYWTLPGGGVEGDETPEQAASRELDEETGLTLPLSLWKIYKRRHPSREFMIEQYIYTSETEREAHDLVVGEGQALRYFKQEDLGTVPIAFGFDKLLNEFFEEERHRMESDG